MMRPVLVALLVAFVAFCVTASASPHCMTFGEARAAFPGKHLFWHTRARCWNDSGRAAAAAHVRQPPLPPRRDKTPMILFPTLVDGSGAPPEMLNERPADSWPLILDVDETTADEPDRCCWPALDDEPPASFRERWSAMPVDWFHMASKR
jgi:hypothetical protein